MTSKRMHAIAGKILQDMVRQVNEEARGTKKTYGVNPREALIIENQIQPALGRAMYEVFNERLPKQDCYALFIERDSDSVFAMLFPLR